jgi:hypothetical protein
MGWRNEVDIVAAQSVLKVEHLFSQGAAVHLIGFLLFPVLAYLVVLTINASHIAIAQENRPRPSGPGNSRLLTVMSADRRDYG